ncbi:MAG: hypothetical protein JWN70_5195 [Planctomycetaceae bacterium]|nr:hypothetical protein [Planctomycetaceae bacterium]
MTNGHEQQSRRDILKLGTLALGGLWMPVSIQAAPPATKPDITATFSIVAVDPDNQVCGAAVASKYPAVGKVVPYVRANVGAFCTQHYHVPKWGEPALDMLQEGKSPEAIIAELLKDDKDAELRQLAIIDMQGRAAVHNPTNSAAGSRYWAAMTGRFYCCQGNTLTGRNVVVAMAAAYEDTAGSLADRLMAALIAADCAGGDHRGRLAAGIRVAKKDIEGDWLALHVDKSDDAVQELAQKYAELKHDAKGTWRGAQLPFQNPCPNRPQPAAPKS